MMQLMAGWKPMRSFGTTRFPTVQEKAVPRDYTFSMLDCELPGVRRPLGFPVQELVVQFIMDAAWSVRIKVLHGVHLSSSFGGSS